MASQYPKNQRQTFNIRPNRSLSERDLVLGASALGVVLALLAIRLLWMGFWLVVPFLLLDFLAVALAFYLIRKQSSIYESIQIDDKQLRISHHEQQNDKSWSFDLQWVRVDLQEHAHPWQPSRLLLGSHGKWIEFANFLTNEERLSLSNALKKSIHNNLPKHYAQ